MHGHRLPRLIERYAALLKSLGLDILCVQENAATKRGPHSAQIAAALGPGYGELSQPDRTGVGIVYDREQLELLDAALVPLPRLDALTWLERRYIVGGRPKQKYAQLAVLGPRAGAPIAVVSFHLETAGTNQHRRAQVGAIADALAARGHASRAVVCGDTNAFAWSKRQQPDALRELLRPLAATGLVDVAAEAGADQCPTHFFARQREPKLSHRLTVMLGKLGLDLPLRYDVICTDLPIADRGVTPAPESDHDIVWAAFNAS